MRKLINKAFKTYYSYRMSHIEHFMTHPHEVQESVLKELLNTAQDTEWGKRFGYALIKDPQHFTERVPIQDYDSLKPFITKMMHGERDILWPGQVRWFSKSSGTTSDKSKFIPVSSENLEDCHLKGSWDAMTLFYHQRPDARIFECKTLLMAGSISTFEPYPKTKYGDISAIMVSQMPWVARPFFTPDFETALLHDFEEKIERTARLVSQESDMVSIGGVPTWVIVLFRRILELTGKSNMLEVWPDFQAYLHGGVSFLPYQEQFRQFFPSDQVSYQEVYNASEGYFATQNDFHTPDMLLLLDSGVYYEFIPMEDWDKEDKKAIPLSEVELGKNYALVISTNAGLWRYMPGDTVLFTSKYPYKIKITGRTKHFINAFGEEVMVENTDRAIAKTSSITQAIVSNYTVAPVYFQQDGKGGHEWLIEFDRPPADLEEFAELLDQNLQAVNSDYEAKRYGNMALRRLRLHAIPPGTFVEWLKAKGKYSSQVKVPRLANDRSYVDEILNFTEKRMAER